MIFTFLIGTVFGVIALVCVDGVDVMKWIFGSENLRNEQVLISGNAAIYLDVCLNGKE